MLEAMVLSIFAGILKGVFGSVQYSDFEQKQTEFNKKLSQGLKLQTRAGHLVQSNGERVIADYLWVNGIPYIYDTPIEVNGRWARPDFILPQHGSTIIEYVGMDSEEYKERLERKLELLASAGLTVVIIKPEDLQNLDKFFR